jgi:chromosome partitioning protein
MKIITLLAQKGGTGKTTLSIHLAVIAAAARKKTVLADIDPQQSATFWKQRREVKNPQVIGMAATNLGQTISDLKKENTDLLVIDTAPHSESDAIIAAKAADIVLIPSRPALLDLEAIGASVSIVNQTKTKGIIVLNSCPFPSKTGEAAIVSEARDALAAYGLPVAPVSLANRVAFSHSLIDGRAVTEFESKGKAASEMRGLFRWIKKEYQLW